MARRNTPAPAPEAPLLTGSVSNPTEPLSGPVRFAAGDVVWQTKQAPDGYRYRVPEDRGGSIWAQPLDPDSGQPARDYDDDGDPVGEPLPPVELNSATCGLAKD